jgi:hypothetical protein
MSVKIGHTIRGTTHLVHSDAPDTATARAMLSGQWNDAHVPDVLRCHACGRPVADCHGVKRCEGGE